jgi:transcriptional regulator with XRE-family HTH domain
MILGQMIQAWREKHHVSRRQLALQIGIDHVTLSRLENNDVRAISVDILGKIYTWQISKEK